LSAFRLCLCLFLFILFAFRSLVCDFVHFSFFRLRCLNSFGHHYYNFPIGSDGALLSSSSPDSFVANSRIPDVLRLRSALQTNWRRLFHASNAASQSDSANVTAQKRGNASPAMNDILLGTTTKGSFVSQKARASMRVISVFVSNEIDDSDLQFEKHDEQIM
jgi:hypothetical protein